MDGQRTQLLKSQSKVDLRKKYQKLDATAARNFYHNILDAIRQSIIESDCSQFRKSAELLQLIHKCEKEDRLESYYKNQHPLQDTNVLLLACEHNEHKIFSQVLLNYCNILSINLTRPPISPADENDEGKNAYYYLMRLNNVEMLKELIEKWPITMEQHEVDVALSKSYFKLILQKVELTSDMIYFVEYTLNKLRLDQCIFGNVDQLNNSFKDIKDRSQILIDSVRKLVLSHDKNARIINEQTLYTLRHITINLNILKRQLRCTYEHLPWEEMEFCLVTFIRNFQPTDELGIYYRACVNKENIFKYLKEFSVQLADVVSRIQESDLTNVKIDSLIRDNIVNDISNKNSTFKELYETFSKIRDFYSLNRMISYIDSVLPNEDDQKYEKHFEILLVEKCLQVLGESIKNSLTSPNLSTDLCSLIFECFSEKLQKIIKDMRNSFSHKYGLRRRVGASTMSIYSYDNFMKIKQDLSEIRSVLQSIFMRIKSEKFEDIFYELTKMKSTEEYHRFKEIFKDGNNKFAEKEITAEEKAKIMRNFNLSDTDEDKKETIKDTKHGIMQIIQEFKSEALANSKDSLRTLFGQLEHIISNKKDVFNLEEIQHKSFITLAETLIKGMDAFAQDPEKGFSAEGVKHLLEQMGMEKESIKKPERLSPLEEQSIMMLIDQITDECRSNKYISKSKLDMYEHKIRCLLLIKEKNLNFMKNLHSDLRLKDKTIQNFLVNVLDDKLDQIRMIFEKYDVHDSPESMKSFVTIYGDTELFQIIEMLLLDVLSIYEDFQQINSGIFDFHFPTLIGKELRNYLAHGNCAVEILDLNIKLCILMNCVYFVNEKPSLISKTEQIKIHQTLNEFGHMLELNENLLRSKADFFNLLKHVNFCELHKCSKIDFLSRDLEGFTVLHAAAHNTDIKIFKHCLTKVGQKTDQLTNKNIFEQNMFHIAALSNNLKFIRHALLRHPKTITLLDDFDYKGCIPMHYASMYGTPEMIELLLKHDKNDVLVEDKMFHKPIHKAILFNNVETFKVLLKFEQNINERYIRGGYSIIHNAAEFHNPEFLSILINHNADVNVKTDKGYTPLHAACIYGRFENVKLLLPKNADPNAEIYETRQTPIFYAIEKNHFEIVHTLLQNNAYAHVFDSTVHYNLLHSAAAAGSTKIIEELINRNVKLHALTKYGQTVVHVAVKYEKYEALKLFLEHNVDVNAIDNTGLTALHMAANKNDKKMFELLLHYKANANITDFVNHSTPLQTVLQNGNMEMIQCLLALGISIHDKKNWKYAVASGNVNVVRIVLEKCDPDYLQSNWRALSDLLFTAIRENSLSITKYLLEKGADIEHVSSQLGNEPKVKPLLMAMLHFRLDIVQVLLEEYVRLGDVRCFDETGTLWYLLGRARNEDALLSIIKLFIKHGDMQRHGENLLRSCIMSNNIKAVDLLLNCNLDVDFCSLMVVILKGYSTLCKLIIEKAKIDVKTKKMSNMTILHFAAMDCDATFVKFLISKGCDVNAQNDARQTPIVCAALKGQGSIVKTLLENGADFNQSLHAAAENDHAGLAEFLLQNGADVNGFEPDGAPLHYAIRYGSQNCINLLLNSKDINVKFVDKKDITPLHVASQVGNLEVTKILIKMGADVDAITKDNVKPIHFAVDNGHIEIIKYYIENGYIKPTDTTSQQNTFLHYAANKANIEIMKYFLNLKLDVNAKEINGNTPLHIAVVRSSWDKCILLIDHGAIFNLPNNFGLTPYEMANDRTKPYLRLLYKLFDLVEVGSEFDVSTFLKANHTDLNLNAKIMEGMSVLHMCVLRGGEKIVEELLKYNINVNITDILSNTPLHYAAKMNSFKMTKDLLAAGAIYNLKNLENSTPFDLSRDKRIKSHLSLIDKCFQCLQAKRAKFVELIRTIENREDQIHILFGPRNLHNLSLYSFIVINELEDVKKKVDKIFNADNLEARKKANMLAQVGEYRKAADILKPIAKKYENYYGSKNPMTLDMRSELLTILYKLNEYKHCVEQNEEITKELIKLYGENNKIVLKSREFTALTLHRLAENKKSLKIYEDVCEKQVTLFGSTHPVVLQTKCHMVLVLNSLGRFEEALKLNYEVYDMEKRIFGENDPRTLVTLNNVGLVLSTQGKHIESMKIYDEVSNKRAMVLGPTHPDTLRAAHNVIVSLKEQKKYKEAIDKLKIIYELQKLKLGENHEETLRTRHALADALLKRGKAMEANEIIRDIYPKLKDMLGPNHPSVLTLQMNDIFLQPQAYASLMSGKCENSEELSSYEQETFFQLIKRGDCRGVVASINKNKNLINVTDKSGVTPLHLAIDNNNLPMVTILLDYGANPVKLTSNGNSILHTAVNRGNIEMTNSLIELIQKSHNDIYHKFLEYGTKKTGKTALHVAAQKNSYEICLLLLQKGAVYNCFTLLDQQPVDLTSNDRIKKLFNFIHEIFKMVGRSDESILERLRTVTRDEIEALKSCHNVAGQTLIQYAPNNKKHQIIKDLIELLKANKK